MFVSAPSEVYEYLWMVASTIVGIAPYNLEAKQAIAQFLEGGEGFPINCRFPFQSNFLLYEPSSVKCHQEVKTQTKLAKAPTFGTVFIW